MSKHTNCVECGTKLGFFGAIDVGGGLCHRCDEKRRYIARGDADDSAYQEQVARDERLASMIVTTEAITSGLEVTDRLGIVGADVAFGQGPIKDIAVGLTNAFGGRSDTLSKVMRETRETALQEMKREALEMGANAIVGVSFSVTALGVGGTMTLLSATGTAVVLADRTAVSNANTSSDAA